MGRVIPEKLTQAGRFVAEEGVDAWLTFVRETAEGTDPVLPLLIEGGLTWQSALLIGRDGRKIAIVGNYDADPLVASGDWDEVVPYVQGIRDPLLDVLERLMPASAASRIAINWSLDDAKADGITHGMVRLLEQMLAGTRFEGSLVSAEGIVGRLRSRKTPEEIRRIRGAIRSTEEILREAPEVARVGRTELEVFDDIQSRILGRGLGFSWDARNDPIVNSGPDSMIGHGIPSDSIRIAPGHLFHIDVGVLWEGYASDLQRTWWVGEGGDPGSGRTRRAPDAGETGAPAPIDPSIPEEVSRAFRAVYGAISAGAALLRPGIEGWRVDEAARRFLVSAGYPEYQHALGHQVGRMAHDGGAILGPRWERYGKTPMLPVERDQVFTLELGVVVEGRGYLGLEEMVMVTEGGIEWLSERQSLLPVLIRS
jgi:Xaa-Pro dipeptidase